MSRAQDLISDLRANAAAATKIEHQIAGVLGRISEVQRALKSRKKLLWLDTEGKQMNPAIDGKNAEVREAQHAAIVAADPEVTRLLAALDQHHAALNAFRAALSGTKRDIQVIETELATIRSELNAKAAEAFGKLATSSNGAGLVGVAS